MMKYIQYYDFIYSITDDGKVFSHRHNKYLKPFKVGKGYQCVHLSHNKSSKKFYVHRLVAEAFIPNPENKSQVNHLNGIKTDNCVANLEWATQQENMLHSWHTLHNQASGIKMAQKVAKENKTWLKMLEAAHIRETWKLAQPKAVARAKELGYAWTIRRRKKVIATFQDNTTKVFDSIQQAGKDLNLCFGNIGTCCNNKYSQTRNIYKGIKFQFYKEHMA